MAPPSFIRGRWTTSYGTGTYDSAVWRGNGVITGMDGTPVLNGDQLAAYLQTRGTSDYAFAAWTSSAWDILRNHLMVSCGTGDQGWTTNEVIVNNFVAGAWARKVDPTVKLFSKNLVNWPGGTYYGGGSNAPWALVDNLGHYPNNAKLDPLLGLRMYPNGRQHYGGFVYMRGVDKFFMYTGFAWWQSGSSNGFIWEYDPNTLQWEAQTRDVPPGVYPGMSSACWDSTNSRVLSFIASTGDQLLAYYPNNPQGSRVYMFPTHFGDIFPFTPGSNNYAQMIWDSKRKCAVMFGGQLGIVKWDFSSNPLSPVITRPTAGGPIWMGQNGPGVLYDPISDLYVAWIGGKTIYQMNPETFNSVAYIPASGDTPSQPMMSDQAYGGIWNRFALLPDYDVYATVSHANIAGFEVFAPVRNSSQRFIHRA